MRWRSARRAGWRPWASTCTREHVEVDEDFSDAELAEIFFHHRVLIVPVLSGGRVEGLVTRHEFFCAVASRFVDRGDH